MSHAIVMGASFAGLCAAAALARNFHRVTVIEREPEPSPEQWRRTSPDELELREQLQRNHRVELCFGEQVEQPIHRKGRVTGVRLRDGSQLHAELVVDASGRSSRSPTWLYGWGYGVVVEQRGLVDEQVRRCYGLMRRLPEGYLIIGEAIACVSTTADSAMTLASLHAEQIAKRAHPAGSSVRLQRRLCRMSELMFELSSGEPQRSRSSRWARWWAASSGVWQRLTSPISRALARQRTQAAMQGTASPLLGELSSPLSQSGY